MHSLLLLFIPRFLLLSSRPPRRDRTQGAMIGADTDPGSSPG